jgi:hypothetical protein
MISNNTIKELTLFADSVKIIEKGKVVLRANNIKPF